MLVGELSTLCWEQGTQQLGAWTRSRSARCWLRARRLRQPRRGRCAAGGAPFRACAAPSAVSVTSLLMIETPNIKAPSSASLLDINVHDA